MPAIIARKSPGKSARTERLEARVSGALKREIQQAARLNGQSITDFVLASVSKAAREAIREHRVLELSAEDSRIFAEKLLNPPAPNAKLKAAFQRHRKLVTSM